MSAKRKVVFIDDYVYHIYNRGVERRIIFTSKKEYERFVQLLDYYRYGEASRSFSEYLVLAQEQKYYLLQKLKQSPALVEILTYCLMPNHFHLILKQKRPDGIKRFLSLISNGYAKYFNTKLKREGPLFQGSFKAVLVETEEQLMHLSRYIHINPVVSAICSTENLISYPWSSFSSYLKKSDNSFITSEPILDLFSSSEKYETFIFDQIEYAKKLNLIKHLTFGE